MEEIVKYVDPHMAILLVTDAMERKLYDEASLGAALSSLYSQTDLFEKHLTVAASYDKEAVEGIKARQKAHPEALEKKKLACKGLLALCEEPGKIGPQSSVLGFLQAFSVSQGSVDALFRYSKALYDCGEYSKAVCYLASYVNIVGENRSLKLKGLWGKLAAEIMAEEWKLADRTRVEIANTIDALPSPSSLKPNIPFNASGKPADVLLSRTWLLHWSLFSFFKGKIRLNDLTEVFLQEKYQNVVITFCPHLIRYAAFCDIVARKTHYRDLLRALHVEYQGEDPVCKLLDAAATKGDHIAALRWFQSSLDVVDKDYFLRALRADFESKASASIVHLYWATHQAMPVARFEKELGVTAEVIKAKVCDIVGEGAQSLTDSDGVLRLSGEAPSSVSALQAKVDLLSMDVSKLGQSKNKEVTA